MRAGAATELSCERLFMRYVDSRMDDTTTQLFERLEDELRGVSALRLTDSSWLADADLRARVSPVLDAFAARGGRLL